MTVSTPVRVLVLGTFLALTGTSVLAQQPAFDAAVTYLQDNQQELGLTASDIEALVVSDKRVSSLTGVTHVYLQQYVGDIPVYNAIVNVAVAPDGRVIHIGNRAVSGMKVAAARGAGPGLSAEDAAAAAARALDLTITEPLTRVPKAQGRGVQGGEAEGVVLSSGGIARDEIHAQLVYLPDLQGSVRLAWMVGIYTVDSQHFWQMGIDASSGAVLLQDDLIDQDTWNHSASPFGAPAQPLVVASEAAAVSQVAGAGGGSYKVYPIPVESPNHAGDPFVDLRTIESNPADDEASPRGWHDDGTTQYTITRGNNAHAYGDRDANNIPDPGSEPDGGSSLFFAPPLDLTADPATYQPAAITNLFYWNNVIHDVMWHYGFDEAAGNFQMENFTGEGLGDDHVRAEALDGSGTNNANFLTPPDGGLFYGYLYYAPRMQMYRWTAPAVVIVNTPEIITGAYGAGTAGFGPALGTAGVTGDVVLAYDPADASGPSTTDGCSPLTNPDEIAGNIALIDRGSCAFTIKVKNAQNAGAIAVIIADNVPGGLSGLGGSDPSITIPSVRVTLDTGDRFKEFLPINVTLKKDGEDRDSDFDNGIITHEYGHGISNRLIGGPSEPFCLNTNYRSGPILFESEQMGEGWSDYYGLMFTDTNTDDRGVGTYVSFEPTTGGGIRPYPYSPSFAVNPATYATIADPTITAPHGVGFVWNSMLWDMTRNLVDRHGFDRDLYEGDGGNNLSMQIVTEGLKLTPCEPGFVDARDAILQADELITGGGNQCLIWDSFARRGLGYSADQGGYYDRTDGTEAFDLPPSCSTVSMVEEQIDLLLADGSLNKGLANSLLSKLQNAEKKIDQGQAAVALNMLNAFINEVNGLMSGGKNSKLTLEEGENLIEYAMGLIARIQEYYPEATSKGAVAAKGKNAVSRAGTAIPDVFALEQNYPNPFSRSTEIHFALPEDSDVRLTVYDLMGREIARLVDATMPAGFHHATLDGSQLASGVYLYRIEAGSFTATHRMIMVK